ncbi:MAG TPA: type I restriction endonuclease, partial [Acidimicrobiia bacterium]
AEEWAKYAQLVGEGAARGKLAKRVADEITARGMIDVLRKGVKDTGVEFKLAYFAPAHDLTPDLRVKYEANRVTVVRQAHVSESTTADSVDLLLLVNGLPVATAELKTQFTGQNLQNAIHQYQRDRNPADLIFRARSIVQFALDQDAVAMTTQLAGDKTEFKPFNLGTAGPGNDGGAGNPANPNGPKTAYLWEVVWQRDNWLNLLGSFVHRGDIRDKAGKKTGKTFMIFPRYHQWDAVNKLLTAAKAEGPGHNKLVQHSAGSGKSNTIAWLAHGLSRLHTAGSVAALGEGARAAGLGPNTPVFDKVIVVTDRKVLDQQLQEVVTSFDARPGVIQKIDENSAQLKEALEGHTARIIITTLQKFPVVAETATNLAGARFAVVVDEAHSSQSGEASKKLKEVLAGKSGDDALAAAEELDAETEAAEQDLEDFLLDSARARGRRENLTFFAFTATPKHKTLSLFGDLVPLAAAAEKDPGALANAEPGATEVYVPFHLYSMRQAIEEKYILDVLAQYTTYKTYYRLANNLSGEDMEVPKGKAASALARYVSLHPTNLAQKAEIIVEHFRTHTASKIGGKAKAMVVTRSRLHAVRYYNAIKAYIEDKGYDKGSNPVRALVAFSGIVTDPDDGATYRESVMNEFPESELPERFEDEYQVLVVAEKYQTGFDQPLLHTMYVDKKLEGVKAVQTLSRLNRSHDGKDDTFVLDFANDAEDIQEAFRPFYTETTATPTDPNLLYTLQRRIMDSGLVNPEEITAAVQAIRMGTKGNPALNAAIDPTVDRWNALDEDDEDKELFRTAVRDYVRTYAFLGQLVPYQEADLEALYYFAKFLSTRLTRDPVQVDLSEAVVLTHLRQEMIAENENRSLEPEVADPLMGPGEGRGKKFEDPTESLEALIATLNDRFGAGLSDVDMVWFEQQVSHHAQDDENKVVALGNDFSQFQVFMRPKIDEGMVERHETNGELVKKYFDDPAFQDLFFSWMTRHLYEQFRQDA